MVTHGISSTEFNKSVIISLVKDKRKSKSSSENYRGISLSAIFSKIFESIVLNKIKDKITTSDSQFGFKIGHSTSLCTAVLQQTIEYYTNGNSNVYLLFLDASKAFDRVKHSKLFECLIRNGVCPLYMRIVFVMYKLNNAVVKWKQNKSDSFKLNNGVKQGGILSPYLFALYIDPLLNRINRSSIGCHVGSKPCNVLSFADDLVLLSPTLTGLNGLIHICQNYAHI